MLNVDDLMQTGDGGRGIVNILAADKLLNAPKLYSTLLLWLLSELFERLPEVGDPDKPKLVFFFDEAHLLFNDAPKALLDKIEQVVRLIRSKGVGVYFVTQNPLDVPETVLGQLGNRVQHALRAFTPRDQKAVKAAAETLRANPKIDTEKAITELAVGEALVSFLDDKGRPAVGRARVRPAAGEPHRAATADERQRVIAASGLAGVYDKPVDRESAYERLKGRAAASAAPPARRRRAGAAQAEAGPIRSRTRWAASFREAGARTASSRRSPRARRARSARPSAEKSFAAFWDRCSAARKPLNSRSPKARSRASLPRDRDRLTSPRSREKRQSRRPRAVARSPAPVRKSAVRWHDNCSKSMEYSADSSTGARICRA